MRFSKRRAPPSDPALGMYNNRLQKGRPGGCLGMDWTVAVVARAEGAAGTRHRNGSQPTSRKIERIPGERRGLQERDETSRAISWGPTACPVPGPGLRDVAASSWVPMKSSCAFSASLSSLTHSHAFTPASLVNLLFCNERTLQMRSRRKVPRFPGPELRRCPPHTPSLGYQKAQKL